MTVYVRHPAEVHTASRYRRKVHGDACPGCKAAESERVRLLRQRTREAEALANGQKLLICRLGCDAAFTTVLGRNTHEGHCD